MTHSRATVLSALSTALLITVPTSPATALLLPAAALTTWLTAVSARGA